MSKVFSSFFAVVSGIFIQIEILQFWCRFAFLAWVAIAFGSARPFFQIVHYR